MIDYSLELSILEFTETIFYFKNLCVFLNNAKFYITLHKVKQIKVYRSYFKYKLLYCYRHLRCSYFMRFRIISNKLALDNLRCLGHV